MSNNFKDQFTLFKTGETKDTPNLSFIKSPQANIIEPTPSLMYPNTEFELLKKSEFIKNLSNRRDNSIIINNYHSNEVGQYAKPKNETKTLFEPLKNDNALAGSRPFTEAIDTSRWSQSLTTRNNEFPENTNIRPESIDSVPLTELVRVREKTQEQLRGNGVNSIRLAAENRPNETSFKGEGISTNPLDINITKYKMKSYYDQQSDDYLKTTGQYIKPEWRSIVQEPSTDRTQAKQMIGPAKAVISSNEYRNNQIVNPTQKEELIENTYISNMKSIVNNTSYRNNNSINPTQKEELIENNYISNMKSIVDNTVYHNNNPVNPTYKEDLIQNTFILNTRASNDNPSYRNNDTLVPTIREQFSDNIHIVGTKSYVDNTTNRNNQSAVPTIREDTSYNINILGTKSYVDNTTHRNNQSALPTIREQFGDNINIVGTKSYVDNTTHRNNQSALPTIREQFSDNINIVGTKSYVDNTTHRNNMSAMPTIREGTAENIHLSGTKSIVDNTAYRNNMSALPTIREITASNNYNGTSTNINKGIVYENNQPINPTLRIETENNNYNGPNYSTRVYQKNNDTTRSGFVEDVLAKDYKGTLMNYVPRNESRKIIDTFKVNESIEKSINLTKRDLMGGGVDQLAGGKNEQGEFSSNMKRDQKNDYDINRYRNVSNSFISEIGDTRGKLLLEQRNSINKDLNNTLNGNPFINNMVHQGSSATHDLIRETTLLNDRRILSLEKIAV